MVTFPLPFPAWLSSFVHHSVKAISVIIWYIYYTLLNILEIVWKSGLCPRRTPLVTSPSVSVRLQVLTSVRRDSARLQSAASSVILSVDSGKVGKKTEPTTSTFTAWKIHYSDWWIPVAPWSHYLVTHSICLGKRKKSLRFQFWLKRELFQMQKILICSFVSPGGGFVPRQHSGQARPDHLLQDWRRGWSWNLHQWGEWCGTTFKCGSTEVSSSWRLGLWSFKACAIKENSQNVM